MMEDLLYLDPDIVLRNNDHRRRIVNRCTKCLNCHVLVFSVRLGNESNRRAFWGAHSCSRETYKSVETSFFHFVYVFNLNYFVFTHVWMMEFNASDTALFYQNVRHFIDVRHSSGLFKFISFAGIFEEGFKKRVIRKEYQLGNFVRRSLPIHIGSPCSTGSQH